MNIKTRIAPSPTGHFHVGTARTALFNWLYARAHSGRFVLRIEDTDTERSEKQFEDEIRSGLEWLGLAWDEEHRQSERSDLYRSHAQTLLDNGRAYQEEGEKGSEPAIILKNPGTAVSFNDIVRGTVSFEAEQMGDIVCIKSDGTPTYNFAVAIDDNEMGISHTIRGEDHISNTPKQIVVQQALGLERPVYAHLPLILGNDRSKLSKRHGATAVKEYAERGYLPAALVNFLALLGWNPGTDKEIFSPNELVDAFSLEQVQKGGAIFNEDKLNWINQQHIQHMPAEDLRAALITYAKAYHPDTDPTAINKSLVHIAQPRVETLADALGDLVWHKKLSYEKELLIWKDTPATQIQKHLQAVEEVLIDSANKLSANEYEKLLMPLANERGRGEVLWPLRVALSGSRQSPSPFELLALIGKKEALARIQAASTKLSA